MTLHKNTKTPLTREAQKHIYKNTSSQRGTILCFSEYLRHTGVLSWMTWEVKEQQKQSDSDLARLHHTLIHAALACYHIPPFQRNNHQLLWRYSVASQVSWESKEDHPDQTYSPVLKLFNGNVPDIRIFCRIAGRIDGKYDYNQSMDVEPRFPNVFKVFVLIPLIFSKLCGPLPQKEKTIREYEQIQMILYKIIFLR